MCRVLAATGDGNDDRESGIRRSKRKKQANTVASSTTRDSRLYIDGYLPNTNGFAVDSIFGLDNHYLMRTTALTCELSFLHAPGS